MLAIPRSRRPPIILTSLQGELYDDEPVLPHYATSAVIRFIAMHFRKGLSGCYLLIEGRVDAL